jgi:hypothetical protein
MNDTDCFQCLFCEVLDSPFPGRIKCTKPLAYSMDIVCDETGSKVWQFNWPSDFDPKWLTSCSGFFQRPDPHDNPAKAKKKTSEINSGLAGGIGYTNESLIPVNPG